MIQVCLKFTLVFSSGSVCVENGSKLSQKIVSKYVCTMGIVHGYCIWHLHYPLYTMR